MNDERVTLERVTMQVELGQGEMIGNTLRQFALRGTRTWQPAAYRVAAKEGTFGLSGDNHLSCSYFFQGRLLSEDDKPTVHEKLCKFERRGDDYVHGNMTLKNLESLNAQSLEVCLVYASGSRTAEQNYAVAERLISQDVSSFIAVPSKHAPTIKFKFKVEPYDLTSETLIIDATPGSAQLAKQKAVSALEGLQIVPQ